MVAIQERLIYIFCVTSEPPLLQQYQLQKGICVVDVDGLFVTTMDVTDNDFAENQLQSNLSDVVWLDTKVREHLDVITSIMQHVKSLIPFNFGTLYKSESSLIQFIIKYAEEFKKNLVYLEEKEEWAVKLYCNKNKIVENITHLSKKVSDINALIQNSSMGKAYILGKKKNEIIENEIINIYNTYSKKIFTKLSILSEEFRFNPIPNNETLEKEDDMILNVVLLLNKANVESFIETSDQLIIQHQNIGLNIEISGPWPCYSFINISH